MSSAWHRIAEAIANPSRQVILGAQRQQARLLAWLLAGLAAAGSVITSALAVGALGGGIGLRPALVMAGGSSLLGVAYVFTRTLRYRLGAALAIATLSALPFAVAALVSETAPGGVPVVLAWLVVPVLLTSAVHSSSAIVVVAAAQTVAFLLSPLWLKDVGAGSLIGPLGLSLGTAGLLVLLQHDRARRLEEAQRELASRGQDIAALRALLDARPEQAEEASDRRAIQLQTAAEIARDATMIHDLDTLLNQVVQLITRRFGYYHAGIFLIDETRQFAVLRAASSEGGRRMLQRGHRLPVGRMGIVGYVTDLGQSRVALDVGDDSVHFANPDLPDTRSEIALPLRVGERVTGALDAQSTEPNAFDEDDVLALQAMADQIAIAIENANLMRRQARVAILRREILDLYHRLGQQQDFEQLCLLIPNAVREAFQFARVTLGLVQGDDVVVKATSGPQDTREPKALQGGPIGQGVLGRTVLLRSPVQITPRPSDTPFPMHAAVGEPMDILSLPLIARERVIGALAIESDQPGQLQEDEVEALQLLSSQVAISLENARLLEEMQRSLEQVDAVYRQQTSEAWSQLLENLQLGVHEANYEGGPSFGSSLPGEKAMLDAPIELRGEVIGSLRLEPAQSSEWEEDDRTIVETVAGEVANALEQARLMAEIQRRATQLEAAAEIARDATGLLDLDTLLHRAVNLIRDRFGLYHVSVFLLDDAGTSAQIREATGDAGQRLKARGHFLPVGSKSIIGHVTQTGQNYVAHDVSEDPFHWPNPLLPGTRTELGIPLKIGQRVIGALDVQHNSPHTFSEDNVAVLQILADQLAVGIQNARLFEETLRRAEREQAVLEITGKVRSSSDVESMLKTAVVEMRKALGAKHGRIHLVPVAAEPSSDGRAVRSASSSHRPAASAPEATRTGSEG